MKIQFRVSCIICSIVSFVTLSQSASAFNELFTLPNPTPQAYDRFGEAVALNDRYLVVGIPGADGVEMNSGAVQVYQASKGRLLRRIAPPLAIANQGFGRSLSLNGPLLAVGNGANEIEHSVVWVYDLSKPKKAPLELRPSASVGVDQFGLSVLISHGYVFVGAPGDNDARGAVYVFDAKSGVELAKLTASTPAPFDNFGAAMVAGGGILVVGAPLHTVGTTTTAGVCYVFRIGDAVDPTFTEIQELAHPSPSENGEFGASLAIGGGALIVGEPGFDSGRGRATHYRVQDFAFPDEREFAIDFSEFGAAIAATDGVAFAGSPQFNGGQGRVWMYMTTSGLTLPNLDGEPNSEFGKSLAIFGNRLVVGAPKTQSNAVPEVGKVAVFEINAFNRMRVAATTGENAVGGGTFGGFGLPVIGAGLNVMFEAKYKEGPSKGVTRAVFGSSGGNPVQRYAARLDAETGAFGNAAAKIEGFSNLRSNALGVPARPLIHSRLSGVSGAARDAIYSLEGGMKTATYLGGYGIATLGDAEILKIKELSQSHRVGMAGHVNGAMLYQLKRSAAANVTRQNDEGMLIFRQDGVTNGVLDVVEAPIRKGSPGPGGVGTYLSISGPHTFADTAAHTIATLDSSGVARQVVVGSSVGFAPNIQWDSQIAAPDAGGANFSRMIGIGNSQVGLVLRATLKGDGVSRRNNEGIWLRNPSTLVVRKGEAVPGLAPGVTFKRFLGIWVHSSDVLFLAQIAGPGIKASNDVGLWARQSDGSLMQLLREGDDAGMADGVKIRTIQRVDMGTNSTWYSALVSLTGSGKTNQALLVGRANSATTASRVLGLPYPKQRKGLLLTSDPALAPGDLLRSLQMGQSINRFGIGSWGGPKAGNGFGINAVLQRLGKNFAVGTL